MRNSVFGFVIRLGSGCNAREPNVEKVCKCWISKPRRIRKPDLAMPTKAIPKRLGAVMHNGNWFAVSRMVFDHMVVGAGQPVKPADPRRGSYSRLEAWLWLIANAAYEQSKIMNKGREMTLNPGQLMGAYSHLSTTWNWTPETVRYFLSSLERAVMLYRENSKQKGNGNHNQCQVISVCNYERYQITFQREPQAIQEAFEQAKAQANPKRAPSQPQESNTRTQEKEKQIAAAAEEPSPVQVNGVAIYGPGFKLDFGAIDMAAGLIGMEKDRARKIAEICARDWAANSAKPPSPMAVVKRALASDKNHGQIDEVRLGKAAKSTPEVKRERMRQWVKDAEEKFKPKPKEWSP